MMKKFTVIIIALLLSAAAMAEGKTSSQEIGTNVVYNLPSTSFRLEVKALKTVYTPGPYAKYAEKYLGIKASERPSVTYALESIKLVPYLEADRSAKYIISLGSNPSENVRDLFMKFTSQGMIMLSDQYKGDAEYWRFPALREDAGSIAQSATENITSQESVLYKNVNNGKGGVDRVAITQTYKVFKSPEVKASEAAKMIFDIREKRLAIVTGDTDATFSGDALRASVETLDRLEHEYLNLFLGTYETAEQKMSYDVLPKAETGRQIIVAFRVSETDGLVSADEITGRPIVMEILPETETVAAVNEPEKEARKSRSDFDRLYYRVPSVCAVRILDGTEVLLQARVPVYQAGEVLSFPIVWRR